MVQARRRGRAAARLHIQIVSLFSVIAVLPAVLVAVVANITIDRGLDRLFSGPTREVIQNSLIVASAYTARARPADPRRYSRHGQRHLPRPAAVRPGPPDVSPAADRERRRPQPAGRDADRQGTQHPGDRANRHPAGLHARRPPEFLSNVDENEPQIAVFPEANYVAAVIRLRAFNDTFLYVARLLDPRVVSQMQADRGQRRRIRPDRSRAGSASRSRSR